MNPVQRYSTGAIVLHWLLALALAGQLALGFAMPHDASGFALIQLHKSIGITILLLSLVRLGWRFTHARPAPVEGGLTGFLASAVHVLLYVFMIGAPLTGWALVSADPTGIPTVLFGAIPWPHLPLGDGVNGAVGEAHEALAFLGIGLFVLHVAGALRHHLMLKDGLLARMSFDGGGMALGLLAASLLLGAGVFFGLGGPQAEEHDHATDHGEEAAGDHAHDDGEAAADHDAMGAADEGETVLADDGHHHVHADDAAAEPTAAATPEPAGPPPSWTIQPGGSLRFTATNAGSALNGSFSSWSGDIAMDPAAPQSARIAIRVDLASASLGDATQDTMLRGAEYLGPGQATWRSTAVRRVSGNRYEADGTLTLKGTSRAQRIAFTLAGEGNRRSVNGSATIDRNAFAVGTGSSAADLAPNVTVNFTFDATR